jgi:hypothetical protein
MSPTGAGALHSGRSGPEMTLPKRLTRDQVMAFVVTSCALQGIPLYVHDLSVLRQVGVLLSMGAGAVGTRSARAGGAKRAASKARTGRILETPTDPDAV